MKVFLLTLALALEAGPALAASEAALRQEIAALRSEIARHDDLYFRQGRPEISDASYDALRTRLTALEGALPAGAADGASGPGFGDDRTGLVRTHAHVARMLSLDKATRESELRAFHARMTKLTGREDLAYVVEPKFDGLAVSLVFERGRFLRAVTRGNGLKGDDITANVARIPGFPHELAGERLPDLIEIRGEVFVPFAAFARVNAEREKAGETPFTTPRSLAVGTIRQTEAADVAGRGLRVVCFGVGSCVPNGMLPATQRELGRRFKAWGLPVVEECWPVRGVEEMVRAVAACERARGVLPFPIDGAVVKLDSLALQNELGSGESAPRWAVACKFAPERVETKLLAITLQIGRTGVLTPVAELSPVRLGGTTVARATLHNREEIARRDLRVGDTVLLEKAGDVIPAVVGVNLALRPREAVPFEFPAECPGCREPLEVESGETAVRCGNPGCPAQVRRRVEHFASKAGVDISGLGPALIERLVSSGLVQDIPDLYRVRRHNLLALGRMSEAAADRVVAAIERSKRTELWRVIYGLGLPQVGPAAARALALRHRSLEALAEADPRGRDLVENLLAVGLQPVPPPGGELPLVGKTFVLTGTLPTLTRTDAARRLSAAGARVALSVSGKTDYVVAGSEPGAKLEQARKLGIKVIDEAAMRQLLGER